MKSNRGFASMTEQRRKEVAARGGKSAQNRKTAHVWTSETASAAGKLGGEKIAQNRDHMATIGRLGGLARAANKRAAKAGAESLGPGNGDESTDASASDAAREPAAGL